MRVRPMLTVAVDCVRVALGRLDESVLEGVDEAMRVRVGDSLRVCVWEAVVVAVGDRVAWL